jgi:hypothetical protein
MVTLTVAVVVARPPAGHASTMTQSAFLRTIKRSPIDRMLSGSERAGIRILTRTARQTSSGRSASAAISSTAPVRPDSGPPPPTNVRVNDPSTDGNGGQGQDPDMTTQSEVSLGVSGTNVVAAYNDDGTSPRPGAGFLSPATDLAGYSWSDDGGTTWHDSQLPNRSPRINLGDPVIATDRAGHFYFVNLAVQYALRRVDVVVGRSDDSGQTFHTPVVIGAKRRFTIADKPWMTVGPDPADPSADVIYVGWQETFVNPRTGELGSRIMVSTSRDEGVTWSSPVTVVDQPFGFGRSLGFVNGVSLAVDPATGRLYVGWEQFVDPRGGGGRFAVRREWFARSDDAGRSFHDTVVVARTPSVGSLVGECGNVIRFGPGRLVRITEFPSLGVGPAGVVLMAFNSRDPATGMTRVRVARSLDGGLTWTRVTVAGPPDSFMPGLSADDTGASIVYYQRVSAWALRAEVATSPDGATWSTQDLSDAAFSVPITFPNFDPFPAECYMGDYVASARASGTTYGAWGDNRDTVTNVFWPKGRPDPNVYFAKL